jgi:hypothetical protein
MWAVPPGEPLWRNPTIGMAACCARAARGRTAATPPSSVMKSRRFTAQYLPCSEQKEYHRLLRCGISIWPMSASVIHDLGRRSFTAMHVRFAPKATIRSSSCDRSRCARTGLMHCSKLYLYSITSSATESSDGGTVRPSILAVIALMTSSNLLDCTTGRSAGLAPLRMRPV